MKLEEWKRFLGDIPDPYYTESEEYTSFEELEEANVDNIKQTPFFVCLNDRFIVNEWYIQYANAKNGYIDVLDRDKKGKFITDEKGAFKTTRVMGDVKIIKFDIEM